MELKFTVKIKDEELETNPQLAVQINEMMEKLVKEWIEVKVEKI
jgi:hypothetical protein